MHDSNRKPQSNLASARLLAVLLAVSGSAVAQRIERDGALLDGVPAAALAGSAPLDRYQLTPQARLLDWLSDGSLLIGAEDPDGLRPERLREALGARSALGDGRLHVRACSAQPYASGWLACLTPEEGSASGLILQDLESGALRTIAAAAARPSVPRWAHDGVRLGFVRTLGDGSEELAVLASPEGQTQAESRLALPGTGWQLLGWSADDHLLLLRRSLASGAGELALANLTDNLVLPLEPAEGGSKRSARHTRATEAPPLQIGAARFSADGRGVYFISNQEGAAAHLHYQEFSGAQARDLTPALSAPIDEFDVSADGHALAYVYREEGISRVALLDTRQGSSTLLQGVPAGLISTLRFNRAADALALTVESGDEPAEVYVYSLTTQRIARWTAGGSEALAAAVRIQFPTWERGGREGSATLYRPLGAGRHPVVLMLREAGPGAPPHFDGFVQYLVNERHLAVLVLTVTPLTASAGSDAADQQQQNQLRDLGALLVWAGLQPDLDRDRMAVIGQGTGAPLALVALGQYAERFRAAVCIDGVFAPTAPLPEMEGAVLLLNGLSDPAPAGVSGEPLLWRLRAAHDPAWYVAVAAPTPAAHELAWRVEGAFLASYLEE